MNTWSSTMESIREIISSAVSDVLNRTNEPGTSNPRTDEGENNERSCRNRKIRPEILPSSFLKKKECNGDIKYP